MAGLNLREVNIDQDFPIGHGLREVDHPNDSSVAILVDHLDAHLFTEHHVREVLAAFLTKWLLALWSINAGQPDFRWLVAWSEHRDGVAVGDSNDLADNLAGPEAGR